MNHSLDEYLNLAAPHLYPELISPEALDHIRPIAALLPPLSASGFECRLGETAPRADFGVRFLQQARGAETLATLGTDPSILPAGLLRDSAWQRIRDFGARWAQPKTLLHDAIEDIFLEFDVEGMPPEIPVPAFFLDFKRDAGHRLEALESALSILWGESLPGSVRRQLFRCLDALPGDGVVLGSVGAMFSRRFNGVRLYFQHFESSAIQPYLERVGWPGAPSELDELLSWMTSDWTLCIDVGETVLHKVGLQTRVDGSLNEMKPGWMKLLDHLVARNLCLPAKRDGLLAWLGYCHARADAARWPDNLRRFARALEPQALCVFLRIINHVKISYQPDLPMEAKAYIGLVQTWLKYHEATRGYVLGDLPEAPRLAG